MDSTTSQIRHRDDVQSDMEGQMIEPAELSSSSATYPSTPPSWPSSISLSTPLLTFSRSSGRCGSLSPTTPDDKHFPDLDDPFCSLPPVSNPNLKKGFKLPERHHIKSEPVDPQKSKPIQTTFHNGADPPCLQCVVKNLPCDRGWPYCSRCSRNGDRDLCLLQRPRHQEKDRQGPITYTIRRTIEDDGQWGLKEGLEEKVRRFVKSDCVC
jgi:hypothetical protein